LINEPLERARLAIAWSALGKRDISEWFHSRHETPPIDRMDGHTGSLNQRIVWESATGNLDFFLELAELWEKSGDFLTERDSEVYTPDVLVAWLNAWKYARNQRSEGEYEPIRRVLRRTWAQLALRSLECDIRKVFVNNNYKMTATEDYPLVTVLAGDRNNLAFSQRLVGLMVAWAIALPRFWGQYKTLLSIASFMPQSPHDNWAITRPWHFTLSVMGCVLGYAHYEFDVDPMSFGLTGEDQYLLRQLIYGNREIGDISYLLEGWKCHKRYKHVKIIRAKNKGGEDCVMVAEKFAANRNKRSHVATRLTYFDYNILAPSLQRGTGATLPEVSFDKPGVTAHAETSGTLLWPEMLGYASLLYSIDLTESGFSVYRKEEPEEGPKRKKRSWWKRLIQKILDIF
jgi:hypothetical protein